MSERTKSWPTKLVATWAKMKATELRRWAKRVDKGYSADSPLGKVCGPYADALRECAGVMDRCAAKLLDDLDRSQNLADAWADIVKMPNWPE